MTLLLNVLQGTKWYKSNKGELDGAWGFVDKGVDSLANGGKWMLSGLLWLVNFVAGAGYDGSGFSCGTTRRLYRSTDWERVFYHAN